MNIKVDEMITNLQAIDPEIGDVIAKAFGVDVSFDEATSTVTVK